ncbi:hypothetical protein ACFB49_31000 [Sphingomonas sp. DBB INV C78]|uniref:hypothetical protein n=1 Tax=Sphingomonas sp. DBB INV C78 TaxID=3349434 RepID=UPI0036D40DFA
MSARELAELIELFPNMTLLDKRMVSGDGELARKLADFDRDHGDKFRAPLAELIAVLTLPLLLALFTLWWALN